MLTLKWLVCFLPGTLERFEGTNFHIQTDGEGAIPGWRQAVGSEIKGTWCRVKRIRCIGEYGIRERCLKVDIPKECRNSSIEDCGVDQRAVGSQADDHIGAEFVGGLVKSVEHIL